jgi:uncharacterized membrane protein ArfC
MAHVHWWLFGLSFATGLVLTLALLVRSKGQVPVRVPAGRPESPTTKIPVAAEFPTTKIPVATESPTTRIPVEKDFPTTKIPVRTESPTTKIPVGEGSPTTEIRVLPPAPYGPGSARATPDGGGPPGWLVKGRSDTRLYYTPDDPTYDPTVAQVWFNDEESAVRAGFTPWRKSSRK